MSLYKEVKKDLEESNYPNPIALGKGKDHKKLKQKIFEATEFLGDESSAVFRAYCVLNDITEIPRCPECGNIVKKRQNENSGESIYDTYMFSVFCSKKCARTSNLTVTKRMDTITKIYGDHNMRTVKGQQEYRDGVMQVHGVDHPMKVKEFAEKCLKTESGQWVTETLEHKQKVLESFKKFNGGHPMREKSIAERAVKTRKTNMLIASGVEHESHISKDPIKVEEFHDDVIFTTIAKRYEYAEELAEYFDYHVSRIRSRLAELGLQKSTKTSRGELQLLDYIKSIVDYEIVTNDRSVLDGKEIDIFIPEMNIGFEFNGLWWHSEKFVEKNYHQQKVLKARAKGIKLVIIWENDWSDNRTLIEKKISYLLGVINKKVGARQCDVVPVSAADARDFYKCNHIQGSIPCKSYGLKFSGELVACIGFKNNGDGVFDLTRYATSCNVAGGLTRLLSHFKRVTEWCLIETFALNDYSDGNMYKINGFIEGKITHPNYIYYSNRHSYTLTRYQCMKHKLSGILDNYDRSLTEHENMRNNGWLRVYDAGSIKYTMTNS